MWLKHWLVSSRWRVAKRCQFYPGIAPALEPQTYSTAVCEPFCRIPDTNGRQVNRHLEDLGALNSCRASRRIEIVGTDRHVQGQIDSVLGFPRQMLCDRRGALRLFLGFVGRDQASGSRSFRLQSDRRGRLAPELPDLNWPLVWILRSRTPAVR